MQADPRESAMRAMLFHVAAAVSASADVEGALRAVCRESVAWFDVDAALVWLREGDEVVCAVAEGAVTREALGMRLPLSHTDAAEVRAVLEAKPIAVNHAPEARPGRVEPGLVERWGVRAQLVVPLRTADDAMGALSFLDLKRPGRFGHEDVDWAETVGMLATASLVQARRLERERDRSRRLAALYALSRGLIGAVESQEVLDRAMGLAREATGAGLSFVVAPADSAQDMAVVAADADPELRARIIGLQVARDAGVWSRVLRTGRPVLEHDVEPQEGALEALTGMRSTIALPVCHGGQTLGVAVLQHPRAGGLAGVDLEFLRQLVDLVGVALSRTRSLELASRTEALRQLDRLTAEFLGTVSHELRTPLTIIHGYAEILDQKWKAEMPQPYRSMVEEIYQASLTMSRMVENLLEFAQIEEQQPLLEVRPVDLAPLIAETVERFRTTSPETFVTLELEPNVPPVRADPTRVRQVLHHLLRNAFQYAEGAPITLQARREGGVVRV
ncbi:MAG TPA: GAF domain-containing protein, partial [Chloroflexota bacterium]